MKYLFLDTNVFLHYIPFEDIPWKNLVSDDFTIVITPIVQQELDKHKDQSRDRIQKRARKISSLLFDYLLSKKKCSVPIVRCKEPVPTDEDRSLLDLSVNDNRIVLSALKSGYPIEDIIFVTGDRTNVFRANDNNIGYLFLEETYRLKPEKTEEEKRIEELERRLKEATERVPDPKIQFEDGRTEIRFERYLPENIDSIIAKKMDSIKKDVPELVFEEKSDRAFPELDRTIMALQGSWNPRYNQDRQEYLEEEEAYLRLAVERDCLNNRFARISFRLKNDGCAPTGEEKVILKVPDNLKIYTKRKSMARYEYIKPLKPSNRFGGLPRETQRNILNIGIPYSGSDNYIWMWNPDIPIEHSGIFEIEPDSVMQKLSEPLELEFYIDLQFEKSFDIQWGVIDEFLPDPVTGNLSVIINEQIS